MRVSGPQGGFGDAQPRDRVSDKKKASGGSGVSPLRSPTFAEELQGAVLGEVPEEVNFEELIRSVDERGRELLLHPDSARLKKYREAVRRFVLAAVRKTFRLKVVESRGPKPKIYVFIEKIQDKLDDVTREVLAAHRDPLKLLAQLEELRGLLLDLKT